MRAAHCSRISCSCPIWIRQRPNRSLQATSAWYARVWPMRNSSSSRTRSCCSQNARRNWMRLCITANSVRNGSASIEAIACAIAARIGADQAHAARAAQLAKADLLTQMVGEFPELQGVMGQYYARLDFEPEEVARACAEHYQPRFSGDTLPSTLAGVAVALADKLETL